MMTSLDSSSCSQIKDAGLAEIAKLDALASLSLGRCDQITGLAKVAKLSTLTSLNLSWCKRVTDAVLGDVAKLRELTSLDLRGCTKLTDAGLREVAKLSGLRLFVCVCKRMTVAGRQQLQRALPLASIHWLT
jgi:F-box/leucine-rich repeat protein 14